MYYISEDCNRPVTETIHRLWNNPQQVGSRLYAAEDKSLRNLGNQDGTNREWDREEIRESVRS